MRLRAPASTRSSSCRSRRHSRPPRARFPPARSSRRPFPTSARRSLRAFLRRGRRRRMREMLRTWIAASSCERACQPVPMMPSVLASSRARKRVATPEAAPVRIWPSASASMIASISPLSLKRVYQKRAPRPFGATVYVLWPMRPSYAAASTWITDDDVNARWRGRFWARPSASARAASSTRPSASCIDSVATTSPSVR